MSSDKIFSQRDSLWLGLHFTQLALDVFDTGDNAQPIAVIEQRYVHCANRDNLEPGLALATAHALYPDLRALERQPERERELLHNLAYWAYQFTPGVVIGNNNTLLLEIGSCRRLYRGIKNLLKKLRAALAQRKQQCAFGLAHTPKAAWLLAQYGCEPALSIDKLHADKLDRHLLQRQLAELPIDLLEADADTHLALKQMGLSTLGALHDIPLAALGKRFGDFFIQYLQQVHGEWPDPQLFFTPTPRFQQGLVFIDGIAQRQMLLFPMKRLLHSLCDYLRARQLHCHTLLWQLFDAHRVQAEFSIELSRTQNDWHTLLELSRLKLEQVPLTALVLSLALQSEDFFETLPTSQQLFPDENDQREAACALIDKLQARLGNNALQRIAIQESYWPEESWRCCALDIDIVPANRRSALVFATTRRESIHGGSETASMPPTVAANTKADRLATAAQRNFKKEMQGKSFSPRPLWLLPQPQLLQQRDNHPCWPTPLTLLRGPERIGNHWWQKNAEERDYYIARNQRSVVCWIFRDRNTQQWFLHGLFG
ncbi:MAG TPA: DNA polymerase Y family protein [Spongiibacteraceae bacterium]